MTADELVDDAEAIGRLEPTGAPRAGKKSLDSPLRASRPAAQAGAGRHARAIRPRARAPGRSWRSTRRRARWCFGAARPGGVALPRGADPAAAVHDDASSAARSRASRRRCWPATAATARCDDILARARPRFARRRSAATIQTTDLAEQRARAAALDDELPLHPGAARHRQDVDGRAAHHRSHPPRPARRRGGDQPQGDPQPARRGRAGGARRRASRFRGLKKSSDGQRARPSTTSASIAQRRRARGVRGGGRRRPAPGRHRVAVRARRARRRRVDTLVIDEAGQVSLADALAMGTAARNVDPARRSAAARPGLAGHASRGHGRARCSSTCSATHPTVPPDMGLFLERTRRMHPGRLPVHLRDRLRRPAGRACRSVARQDTDVRHGAALPAGRPRRQRGRLARGGRARRARDRAGCVGGVVDRSRRA